MSATKEAEEYKKQFDSFDQDGDGNITNAELGSVLKNLHMYESEAQVKALIAEIDKDNNGTIQYGEFLKMIEAVKKGHGKKFGAVYEKQKDVIKVQGHSGLHSFAQEEMTAFAEHINFCLGKDKDLDYVMPIDTSAIDLCKKVKDGVLLCKLINLAVRDTVDERALNKKKDKNSKFQCNENLTLAIASAKAIGVQTVNIGAGELFDGEKNPHIVLGLIWQLVKIQLLNSINLKSHPELVRLLNPNEELADLLKLPPEALLLRWINYHLKNAGHPKTVGNFSGDVKDSTAYTILLNQIDPAHCDKTALTDSDVKVRAEKVLANAEKVGAHAFIKPSDIVQGNARLNLVFAAAIFNANPGLQPLTKEEIEKAGIMDDDVGSSREERAFRMWINSLGVDDLYINSLFEDCKDGLVLLRVMDKVEPGCVDWKKAEMKPTNKFKRLTNCNLAVTTGQNLKFSLIGIGGSDIHDGNKKLLLGLVWQLMRFHTFKFLAEVQKAKFGGTEVTEDMIVQWANEKVKTAGKNTVMASLKDGTLSNGLFFIDLLSSVEPRIIDPALVTAGDTDDNKLLNAKYAISIARKLGATIFLLPEDITEVKHKMILTFIASIMAISK